MYKGTLIKWQSTNDRLRTGRAEGFFSNLPTPGQCFNMLAEPLADAPPEVIVRTVRTSTVQFIDEMTNSKIVFRTLNSTYTLEYKE